VVSCAGIRGATARIPGATSATVPGASSCSDAPPAAASCVGAPPAAASYSGVTGAAGGGSGRGAGRAGAVRFEDHFVARTASSGGQLDGSTTCSPVGTPKCAAAIAPQERPGRPYPARIGPCLSLPPNAAVTQWPQMPTMHPQSHFDGNGTMPYQCWMCWQICRHASKARRHNCLATSRTYSCPYCPFTSVVKNPSGHRVKCEGDGVTAYLPSCGDIGRG